MKIQLIQYLAAAETLSTCPANVAAKAAVSVNSSAAAALD
jgi:hypothetical protein